MLAVGGLTTPNKIQPKEYSTGGGIEDRKYNNIALNSDGNRLNLGNFDENGLNCDNWNWNGDNRNSNLGCFPLMVSKIKKAILAFFS